MEIYVAVNGPLLRNTDCMVVKALGDIFIRGVIFSSFGWGELPGTAAQAKHWCDRHSRWWPGAHCLQLWELDCGRGG